MYSLSTNPSSDIIDKVLDEQENMVNSDDEDEQAQMPVDDIPTECNNNREKKNFFNSFRYFFS